MDYKVIYKRVYDVSKDGRLLSKNDLREIFYILRDQYDLDIVCNNLVFSDELNNPSCIKSNGICYFIAKHIELNLANIRNNAMIDTIYGTNLTILRTLLHEVEHARQFNLVFSNGKFKNNSNDIDLFLNVCSYNYLKYFFKKKSELTDKDIAYIKSFGFDINSKDYAILLGRFQKSLYTYAPNERMAHINSLSTLSTIVKHYDKRDDIIDTIQYELNNALLRGYNKIGKEICIYSPSYRFLRGMKFDKQIDNLKQLENKYLFDESFNTLRMYYGVHVDDKFINEKQIKTRELKNKLGRE